MRDTLITEFDTRDALLAEAASLSTQVLERALTERDAATFFASGGSTPGPLYKALSGVPLDWAKVQVGLADERWVGPDHEASNAKLVRETLLQSAAAFADFVPMVTDAEADHFAEAAAVDALYQPLTNAPDLMVLGMGGDAHTLSWFPGAEGIDAALDTSTTKAVCAITAKKSTTTGDNLRRITLTAPVVARTKNVLLLITGEEKRRVFETATPDTPIAHMIAAAQDRLKVFWSK